MWEKAVRILERLWAIRPWHKIACEWKNKDGVGATKNAVQSEASWASCGGFSSLRQPSEDPPVSQEWACLSIPTEICSVPKGSLREA